MNRKFSLGITISLMAIACAITFVITWTVSLNSYNERFANVTNRDEFYSKIQEVDAYVRTNAMASVDENRLMSAIIDGYIDGINDPYAEYLSDIDYVYRKQIISGTITGIGIEAIREESGYIIADVVYTNSPAAKAGIQRGDVITAIGGRSVLEIGQDVAIQALKSEAASRINVTIQRSGAEQTFTLISSTFEIQSVMTSSIDTVGYIRINAFNDLTAQRFIEAVNRLERNDVTCYVIDLRDCNGVYSPLSDMIGRIAGNINIANFSYKDGSLRPLTQSESTDTVDKPMVVLVDENTSGPAELFAHALHTIKSAQLVGRQTVGNCTMQEIKSFSDNTAIAITVANVIPTQGENYSGIGLHPEYNTEATGEIDTTPTSLTSSTDAQLLKAFEVISSTTSAVE